MPKKIDSLNNELFGLLKSHGFKPKSYDSSGDSVPVPEEADAFQFQFIQNGQDYGKVTVSIDGDGTLSVYYDEDMMKRGESTSSVGDAGISWSQFLQQLKQWGMKRRLTWAPGPVDDLESDMAKRAYIKKEGLNEAYHSMGRKASYNDNIPETKIIIKHSRNIEEGEQRYRNVERIFIENALGERILAPTTKPGVAQVYARHIAEGGLPHDERWNHIKGLCEEYNKMAGFVRATRGGQFNESAQRLVTEGINHYVKLRESLGKMRGKKGYNSYFESWTPPLMEDEGQEDLSEMFMSSSLDPRIESVMPILSKLNKTLGESSKMAEVIALEAWADDMASGSMGSGNDPISIPEDDEDYVDPEEADYGDEYQKTVSSAGEAVKRIEKKLGQVDIAALAKKLNKQEVDEAGPAGKPGDHLGATDKVTTGKILGNKPQSQKGLRGKLVGENVDPLIQYRKLSGL